MGIHPRRATSGVAGRGGDAVVPGRALTTRPPTMAIKTPTCLICLTRDVRVRWKRPPPRRFVVRKGIPTACANRRSVIRDWCRGALLRRPPGETPRSVSVVAGAVAVARVLVRALAARVGERPAVAARVRAAEGAIPVVGGAIHRSRRCCPPGVSTSVMTFLKPGAGVSAMAARSGGT